MNKTKKIILTSLGILIFVAILEIYITGIVLFSGGRVTESAAGQTARMAILLPNDPILTTGEMKRWNEFAKNFREAFRCSLELLFTHRTEDVINGLTYNTLDLVYCTPQGYLDLERSCRVRPLYYHRLSARENEQRRAVILCRKKINTIDESKGMRLCVVRSDLTRISEKFLQSHLPEPVDRWFSSVVRTNSPSAAFEMLKKGTADLIAVGRDQLETQIAANPENNRKNSIVWISLGMPENLLCVNLEIPRALSQQLSEIGKKMEWMRMPSEFLRGKNMSFLPVDFGYLENLATIKNYMNQKSFGDEKAKETL